MNLTNPESPAARRRWPVLAAYSFVTMVIQLQ
jgi:hypothetical protein